MNATINSPENLTSLENRVIPDFYTRAKKIVANYIKSAVLIDDDWPYPGSGLSDGARNKAEEIVEEAIEAEVDDSNQTIDDSDPEIMWQIASKSGSSSSNENASRLVSIHDSFVKRGIICTGFKYTKQEKDIAPLLAKNADILILDWNFAGDSGAGALEILNALKKNGQLQFVCIFTDERELSNIKIVIFKSLYDITPPNVTDFDFKIGCFVFTLRNKDVNQIVGDNTSTEENLFEDAVSHIALHYGGYLQLSMLEMTSRHRNTMLSHLTRFSPEFDAAILSDSAQMHSPVTLGENLRSLLLDEWKIALEQSAKESAMEILSIEGRASYAAGLKTSLAHITLDFMYSCLLAVIPTQKKPPVEALFVEKKFENGMEKPFDHYVKAWLDGGATSNIQLTGLSPNNAHKVTLAILYALSHPERVGEPIRLEDVSQDILKLDALFNQQILLPDVITQGTILKYDATNYFICITPLCDSARLPPGYHSYTFLHAQKAAPSDILKQAADYCIFIEQSEPICLHVNVKRPYVFEISDKYRKLVNGTDNVIRARHRLLPITAGINPKLTTAPQPQAEPTAETAPQPQAEPTAETAPQPQAEVHVAAVQITESRNMQNILSEETSLDPKVDTTKQSPNPQVVSTSVAPDKPATTPIAQDPQADDSEDGAVPIKFQAVGQLRTDFFLMLSASAASNASRVGVNRVEFIRAEKTSSKN